MLEDIKLILGIADDKSDGILKLMIKDATQAVLNYCHIKKLPESLYQTVREIVIQQYQIQNEGNIAAIKRGDTQITYAGNISAESFTARQKSSLNAHRLVIVR